MNQFEKQQSETFDSYCHRIAQLKQQEGYTWDEIADIINDEWNVFYSESYYRKKEKKYVNYLLDDEEENLVQDQLLNLEKQRIKLSDERKQINALIRKYAREDTIKEIAYSVANTITEKKLLSNEHCDIINLNNEHNDEIEALLLISDWHYGICIENCYNSYNPEIAIERINQLKSVVIQKCKKENINKLNVLNLGDMISGIIHLPLRINSRIDVITQVIQVSEILAEFLFDLSNYFTINYYSTADNHSRIEQNKKENINLESLYRITDWYLKYRLKNNNVAFHENKYGNDIATLNILNHEIVGIHGDKDKQNNLIEKINNFTQHHYEMICSAHMHHFSADENCDTIMIANGSLMGTDDYAFDRRLHSQPSQNLIFITKNNVTDSIHKINLI